MPRSGRGWALKRSAVASFSLDKTVARFTATLSAPNAGVWRVGVSYAGNSTYASSYRFGSLNVTGKYLLDRSRRRLEAARQTMRDRGLSDEQLAERTYWDSLTFDAVKHWRSVHFPITLAFAVLALAHIVAVFLFWGWK